MNLRVHHLIAGLETLEIQAAEYAESLQKTKRISAAVTIEQYRMRSETYRQARLLLEKDSDLDHDDIVVEFT